MDMVKCMLRMYNPKAFKLYNPKSKNVIISRDITFDKEGI